jgi:endoglucanase Acf2
MRQAAVFEGHGHKGKNMTNFQSYALSRKAIQAITLLSALCVGFSAQASTDIKPIGAGGLRLAVSSGDRSAPEALYRTPAMKQRAAPTNQWYSSVMFTRWSNVLHAVPLTYKATEQGLEIGMPDKTIVPSERRDVEVHYPHRADLTIQPAAFKPEAALLAGHGDWSVDVDFAQGPDAMRATILHGSPMGYIKLSRGDALLSLGKQAQAQVWSARSNVLVVRFPNRQFALYAPSGATWAGQGTAWTARMPSGSSHIAVATLPQATDDAIARFERSAYLEITNTRADFRIDKDRSEVVTTFKATVQPTSAQAAVPMLGLYPHHYHNNPALTQASSEGLPSIRGAIRLLQADQFETRHRYNGFVPYWPGLQAGAAKDELRDLIKKDARKARRMMLEIGNGPYWQGKGLQRIALLMGAAAREGMNDVSQDLLGKLQERAQSWLSGESKRTYFHYDKQLGTVVSYPEEYDAVKDMNDHHFHYGYWIRAAAEMALQDPQWAQPDRWGGMIDELIKDIATTERGRRDYPYLRNFDPYEGHAWASGVGMSDDGNNQESSSESINAWSGLMLWGALSGRQDLIDLGTYLYTTEIQAINHYWFDIYGTTLPPEYQNSQVSIVFGGKLVHNTWWIDEPRQIHGINLLPFTPASTYLATSPEFVKRSKQALDKETAIFNSRGKRAKPEDIWQDLFAQHVALVDPQAGIQRWDRWGSFELGDTRSRTYHWLQSLNTLGPVDLSVSANTTFYAVFKNGNTRTYLVYNPGKTTLNVQFSDGQQVQAQTGLNQSTKTISN